MLYYDTHLDGIMRIEKKQFDALEKQKAVLYIVEESDGFSLHLGSKAIMQQKMSAELKAVINEVNEIRRRLGMMVYTFPDLNGDGRVTTDEATFLLMFSSKSGTGAYDDYKTEAEKWAAFAAENEIDTDVFPDVNGDGSINSEDYAIVSEFISKAGAGKYTNSAEGFRRFMLDRDNVFPWIDGTSAIVYGLMEKGDLSSAVLRSEASGTMEWEEQITFNQEG